MHNSKTGFTLVELLVAAAVSLILSSIALSSLVTLQQMSQQMDERLVQETELKRALHLMAADIQEGQRIEAGAPVLSGYQGLFQVIRPDNSTVGYYTTPGGNRVWAGPHIIFRRDSSEERTFALVDQIADVKEIRGNPADLCTGSGTLVSGKAGFVVWIDRQSTAKICLLGHLSKSREGIGASVVSSTRVSAGL